MTAAEIQTKESTLDAAQCLAIYDKINNPDTLSPDKLAKLIFNLAPHEWFAKVNAFTNVTVTGIITSMTAAEIQTKESTLPENQCLEIYNKITDPQSLEPVKLTGLIKKILSGLTTNQINALEGIITDELHNEITNLDTDLFNFDDDKISALGKFANRQSWDTVAMKLDIDNINKLNAISPAKITALNPSNLIEKLDLFSDKELITLDDNLKTAIRDLISPDDQTLTSIKKLALGFKQITQPWFTSPKFSKGGTRRFKQKKNITRRL